MATFSVALQCNSLQGNQQNGEGKSNELSLVLLCLNKAIAIYIYKITSHKYIWQYDVLNFFGKGGFSNMTCARVSKCQSKWLSDNFSGKKKTEKKFHAL